MRDVLKFVIVLPACAMWVVGCSNGEKNGEPSAPGPKSRPAGAAAPVAPAKAAAVAFHKAVKRDDHEAILACLDASEEEAAYLKKMFTAVRRMTAFEQEAIRAFGEDAWRASRSEDDVPMSLGESLGPLDQVAKQVTVKEMGDKATSAREGDDETLKLVRKDGVWLVRPPASLVPPNAAQREAALKVADAMADALEGLKKKITEKDMTAAKLRRKIATAAAFAMGLGGAPATKPAP